jgi:hypothetical protein
VAAPILRQPVLSGPPFFCTKAQLPFLWYWTKNRM